MKDDWTGDTLSQNDEASQWRWGGMSPRGSRTVGAAESAVALTLVEALDAFNPTQKQPLSLGVGHSVRWEPDGVTPVRELHFGIGTSLPDLVRTFAPHAARYLGIPDFYYFNLNLTATVK